MIEPEGSILHNLDEFMLRLGHITAAIETAASLEGNLYRINLELSDTLTAPTAVPPEQAQGVAEYLKAKGLCPIEPDSSASRAYRYPALTLYDTGENIVLRSEKEPPTVWWQDLMLADPKVPSKVGGITTSARSGSKTGVSHILDWAQKLDFISASGDLSAAARLVSGIRNRFGGGNPYVMGFEKIVYAWRLLTLDFDVLSRLAPVILSGPSPIPRKEATAMFVVAVEQLEADAQSAKRLTSQTARSIYSLQADLSRAADKTGKPRESTSTSWHRASSRFETLVDLGFLAKPNSTAAYSYLYEPTILLEQFSSTLDKSNSVADWFADSFMDLFGEPGTNMDYEGICAILASAVDLLRPRGSLIPLNELSLALSITSKQSGSQLSLGNARSFLLAYARNNPARARLSSGRYGKGAEFISLRSDRRVPH